MNDEVVAIGYFLSQGIRVARRVKMGGISRFVRDGESWGNLGNRLRSFFFEGPVRGRGYAILGQDAQGT